MKIINYAFFSIDGVTINPGGSAPLKDLHLQGQIQESKLREKSTRFSPSPPTQPDIEDLSGMRGALLASFRKGVGAETLASKASKTRTVWLTLCSPGVEQKAALFLLATQKRRKVPAAAAKLALRVEAVPTPAGR